MKRKFGSLALIGALAIPILSAQEAPRAAESNSDLANLDLTALMNIEITSVSRRPERLSDAAASVFVITADEIRRSGATNLPETLRLAPNLDVVQVSASAYTVSARGFINSAANKLLVLIDGRAVYTPLFGGVFWDVQDVLLEDVERIEVISGPGGTLWGVNAVNGIINIMTRSAKYTEGGLFSAGAGNRDTIGALRYGGPMGTNGDYRVYAKSSSGHHTETANGTRKDDAWHRSLAGFRLDWERAANQLMLVGAAYRGSEGQPLPGAIVTGTRFPLGVISISGLNLTARWKRALANGSSITVQGYFDRTERDVPPAFEEKLDLFDLQVVHTFRPTSRQLFAWGAEYRYGKDRVVNSPYVAFLPANVNQKWPAVFAQDEIPLHKNLRVTAGARLERNDYTGTEFLPNVRLAWNVAPDHLLWAAASRTVRAPSRLDRDTFVPGVPPFLLIGGPEVVSEIANVYEIGYRAQPAPALSFSIAAFHSLYDHLRSQEVAPSGRQLLFANGMEGTATGVETWASFQARRHWRLSAGFNGLREEFALKPGSNDVAGLRAMQGRDPRRSWRFRSSLALARRSELDVTARRVSARSNPNVPAYSAVDVRYGWKPRSTIEISVTGLNLLGKGHGEFTDVATRTELRRGIFIKFVTYFGRGS